MTVGIPHFFGNDRLLSPTGAATGGVITFYYSGTTNLAPIWADVALTTPLPNPLTVAVGGLMPKVFLSSSIAYRRRDTYTNGNVIDLDPLPVAMASDLASQLNIISNDIVAIKAVAGADYTNAANRAEAAAAEAADYLTEVQALFPYTPTNLSPGPLWTGTAGSGFSTAEPTDPTRTTAKPALRLIVPPNQRFTDTLVVGVVAGANDSGSFLNTMGLRRVDVYFENNNPISLKDPQYYTYTDARGIEQTRFGYWVTLKKPSGLSGHGRVYFRAVPRDAAMQSRVIGPFQFSPQATLYDATIEVNSTLSVIAGTRYQSLSAAFDYLRTQAKENPIVTMTGGGPYDLITPSFNYVVNNNWVHVTATVPVVIKNLTTYAGDGVNATLRPSVFALHFQGPNITFDFVNTTGFYTEAGARLWLDGINVTNSGGQYALYRGSTPNISNLWRENPWITECAFSNLSYAATTCSLVRGGTFTNMTSDLFSDSFCVIDTMTTNLTSAGFTNDLSAMTVTYAGAATTATIEVSGGVGDTRVVTLKQNGSSVGTFTVNYDNAAYLTNTNYTVQNVVTWINTNTGWSATLLNNSRQAACLGVVGSGGGAFSATNAKSVIVTLVTNLGLHPDWYQMRDASTAQENLIIASNTVINSSCQDIFLNAYTVNMRDILILNNAFDNVSTDGLLSQFGPGNTSHLVVAHNSWSSQGVVLRADQGYNPGSYCLIANNIMPTLTWGGTPDTDQVITNNHLMTGATTPSGATGTTTGGTRASIFVNAIGGDFNIQGEALSNLKPSIVRYDSDRFLRSATDAAGSLAA